MPAWGVGLPRPRGESGWALLRPQHSCLDKTRGQRSSCAATCTVPRPGPGGYTSSHDRTPTSCQRVREEGCGGGGGSVGGATNVITYLSMSASRDARPSSVDPTGRARTSSPCRSSSAVTRAFKVGWTRSHDVEQGVQVGERAAHPEQGRTQCVGVHVPWLRRPRTLPMPGHGSRCVVARRLRSYYRCQTGPSSESLL